MPLARSKADTIDVEKGVFVMACGPSLACHRDACQASGTRVPNNPAVDDRAWKRSLPQVYNIQAIDACPAR